VRLTVTDMPENFPAQIANGRTMSVFSHVMNLTLDTDRETPSVVTIDARDNAPLSPGTARLNAPAGLDFSRVVRPGSGLAIRAGILRIQDTDLTFDFRGAAPMKWHDGPTRPKHNQSELHAGWVDAWSLFVDAPDPSGFAEALTSNTQSSGFDRALARRVRTAVPDLMHASADMNLPSAWASLHRLLGTGPGLTPSGDDFATGFFLGMQSVSPSPGRKAFLGGLTKATLVQSGDSTEVSSACLEHAAAGRFSAPLTCFVEGIISHADNLPARLADVLAMGHSSGRDVAFGILCGLAVTALDLRARVNTRLNNVHLHEKTTQ
jgi:hypothetical protein